MGRYSCSSVEFGSDKRRQALPGLGMTGMTSTLPTVPSAPPDPNTAYATSFKIAA
jgi:hypothetical protein